jgi:hypothetical protein
MIDLHPLYAAHDRGRKRNRERPPASPADWRCLLCEAPVRPERARWVHVHIGGSIAVTDDEAEKLNAGGHEAADMGGLPVGPECFRRHPELRAYAGNKAGE